MIPAFDVNAPGVFLGFRMCQNRYAIPAWSYLFEKTPGIGSIVEIGTNVGGMSCLLALAAFNLKASFDTIDTGDFNEETLPLFRFACGAKGGFHKLDVFSGAGRDLVKERVSRHGVSILLCDGGNKVKEFRDFAPFLKTGDIIAAHDFGAKDSWPWEEIKIKDVGDVLSSQKLQRFMEDVFENTGWLVCRKAS